jgi:peptidoglycan-associated lipoprotein
MKAFFHRSTSALALFAAVALAGCASSVKLDEPPVESRTPGAGGAGGAGSGAAGGAPQSQVGNVDLTKQQGAGNGVPKIVYFDFDSFVVKDEFRPVVEAHAKQLSGDRAKRVVIEGHTDERGGREYNLALGQKRAEAVAKSLSLLGAQTTQVEAVSYGEERPAATGSDETAWAQNRRAELRDR